jgi:hypothetical protein
MKLDVTLTDADLDRIIFQLPPSDGISGLAATIQQDGVHVTGKHTGIVTLPFEMIWTLGVGGDKVNATLADLRVAGLPAEFLRSLILGKFTGLSPKVTVSGDVVMVDLSQPYVSLELSSVTYSANQLNVKGG